MNRYTRTLFAAGIAAIALSLPAMAQEKQMKRADLPAAVEKTVAEQSKGATIKGFSTEVEGGKKVYEMALTVDGRGKDISMDAQGKILEVEEEVQLSALPSTVKDGLAKAAGKGALGKVESLTKNGQLVAYEAVVKTAGKNSEVQVGPDGKKLAHPQ